MWKLIVRNEWRGRVVQPCPREKGRVHLMKRHDRFRIRLVEAFSTVAGIKFRSEERTTSTIPLERGLRDSATIVSGTGAGAPRGATAGEGKNILKGMRRVVVLGVTALIASLVFAPTASANGPNGPKVGPAHPAATLQSATWLAAKNSYRIISGIKPNQGKHGEANPTVLATPLINLQAQASFLTTHLIDSYPPVTGEPSSYILYNGGGVEYVAEPGDGWHTNIPFVNLPADDAGTGYNDGWFFTLCGPGAADVAMYWWPAPANDSTHAVTDQLPGNGGDPGTHTTGATTWYGQDGSGLEQAYRLRGYMLYLAFSDNTPTWVRDPALNYGPHQIVDVNGNRVTVSGMLPEPYYETGIRGGATLQAMSALMNWEASGNNLKTWIHYFYTVQWNNGVSNIGVSLHNDIVADIASSHVPVVVEVDASKLPNWNSGGPIYHFIAITGYDDTAGVYYYFDTCKAYTNCNQNGTDTPDLHTITQSQLTAAVSAIPTNQSTGDGGWIW